MAGHLPVVFSVDTDRIMPHTFAETAMKKQLMTRFPWISARNSASSRPRPTPPCSRSSTPCAPRGVTNHFGRILIPNDPIRNDDDFNVLIDNIRKQMMDTIDQVMTCEPDYLVMGMSSETFWDGLEGSQRLQRARRAARRRQGRDGLGCLAGRRCSAMAPGGSRVITPYMPVGDAQVRKFFERLRLRDRAPEGPAVRTARC